MSDTKLCWFCRHFYYNEFIPDYSELTPGEEWSIGCRKNMWEFSSSRDGQAEFAAAIMFAEKCPHFELNDEIKQRAESLVPKREGYRGMYASNWKSVE
jgi:hypothetical protein